MNKTREITLCGIIAAAYVALTWVTLPVAFTPIQLRLSELLTLIPFFFPPAAIALTVGCFFANIFSNAFDLFLGPLATLIAAFFTAYAGRKYRKRFEEGVSPLKIKKSEYFFAVFPPVIFNAVIVSLALTIPSATNEIFLTVYLTNFVSIFASEIVSCAVLGVPFIFLLNKYDVLSALNRKK